MAGEGAVAFVGDSLSMKAGANLSTLQYRFMLMSAAGAVNKATGATSVIIGILQNKPASTAEAALVKAMGGSKLVVDASTDIAAGDKLTSDANGKGVKATVDTNHIGAIALEAATEDGDVISVLICNFTFAG